MTIPGEVRVVDDVPKTFAQLLRERAPRSIALSGGTTAEECYRACRSAPMDWSEVTVFFGDDRVVPADHESSNEGMARRALLDAVSPRVIHSLVGLGATAYDALLRSAPPIDLVHLGLGPDGHTASLFPGSPACDERERFVVETGDEHHPLPRLTFTFPAIARARLAVVTVDGPEKHEAVARIRAGEDLPGARIRAEEVLWIGDRASLGAD